MVFSYADFSKLYFSNSYEISVYMLKVSKRRNVPRSCPKLNVSAAKSVYYFYKV